MPRYTYVLRVLCMAALCVGSTGAANAALHQDEALFMVPTEVITAELGEQKILVAQWNEKKIRGIVKEYTDAYAGSGSSKKTKKAKNCKTITHSNPEVQKRMRQACSYQNSAK